MLTAALFPNYLFDEEGIRTLAMVLIIARTSAKDKEVYYANQ